MVLPPINPALAKIASDIADAKDSPIPGPVIDAFLPESVKIGPFSLPVPNMATLLLLHSASSPFVTGRPITAAGLIVDLGTAVHLLAHEWDLVKAQIAKGEISDRIWETLAKLPAMSPEEMQTAVRDVAQLVNKGFSTALKMGKAAENELGLEEAQKKMPASDGGSSSSAGCAGGTT